MWEGDNLELTTGHHKIMYHVIFDVKVARVEMTYSSVVSRSSFQIALTIAAVYTLDILSCEIQNAYLTLYCRQQVWIVSGPEFGSEVVQYMLIKKSLYVLKISGAAFRSHLSETIYAMGYKPTT